jgi:hypothetical protein
MKNRRSHLTAFIVTCAFVIMALASATPRQTYQKPVVYPCVQHPALTYSPILIQINISSSYNMKDISTVREDVPTLIMTDLQQLNSSYKLADGVTPNLVLNITYTNDGYDHYGVVLTVDWQGEANFTITLPTNYVTIEKLISDMTSQFNGYIAYGWHSGNCD